MNGASLDSRKHTSGATHDGRKDVEEMDEAGQVRRIEGQGNIGLMFKSLAGG